ncbi:MFS transporter [Sorangium cellulosum]|uniref:MFS transporter n=1 Tax=Sorangium cellulosum TaxID=56 RepID=A0A2L0EWN6_SORCE|nr:MFS transporter [Sorangium cellulosum]AUX43706.1 MFS transporter [Sorangium cellulosum]
MLRRIPDRNIWLIYGAIFLLGLAYGIAISLTAVFLDQRGFTKSDIGLLASCFALGIALLSLPMDALIRRFSAKTTLVLSLIGYAGAVGVFPFLPTFAAIAAVRFLDGACSVGIWVSCETILLARSDRVNKAFVTSLYAVSMALGYVLGPLCAPLILALSSMHTAFLLSCIISLASACLVLSRLDRDLPGAAHAHGAAAAASGAEPPASSASILWRIKTACFATFAYGYFQASVVLFLPLYLMASKGVTLEQTIRIPAFFAVGMLAFSNVAGRVGDRHGHLFLMRVLGAIGTLMVLGFVYLDRYDVMCVVVLVAGATLASISPLSLALQGVVTAPRDYSRANSLYNVFYAAGMLLGPPLSSVIYERAGGAAMIYHLAALWAAFVVFTIVFAGDDPAARRGERGGIEAAA